MTNGLKLFTLDKLKKSTEEKSDDDKLLEEIRGLNTSITNAYNRFEYEEDDDLVEAAIYELEALKARNRYLIKLAKEQRIESKDYTAFWGVQYQRKGVEKLK